MSTQNPFSVYFRNQALASIGKSHPIELALQTRSGLYKGMPWQNGHGLASTFHTFMCRFIPILKLIAKTVGKHVLKAGADFVSDVIEGKPVQEVALAQISDVIKPQGKK